MKKRIISFSLCLMFSLAFLAMPLATSVKHVSASSEQKMYQRRGGTVIGGIAERIDYTSTTVDTKLMTPSTPSGYDSGISCGITAAGVTVAYNDITLTNLIPNFTPASQVWGAWFWNTPTSDVSLMYSLLNLYMGNNGYEGVTISEYKDGLVTYVNMRGYNIAYTDVRAGNNSLTSGFKDTINNGKLVSLFFNTFNISFNGVQHYPNSKYDYVDLTQYAGLHIMVAYGYKEIKYYNASGLFRTDFYAAVQTGYSSNSWIRINDYCTLDAAWVTNIY